MRARRILEKIYSTKLQKYNKQKSTKLNVHEEILKRIKQQMN